MTINENPSGLPEQEPTSTTAVVLLDGETWAKTGADWESPREIRAWGDLRNLAAERGGATLFDLADLPTGLTEVQKEAVRSIESKFLTGGGLATDIRNALPEAFADDLVTAKWKYGYSDEKRTELLRVARMEGAHAVAVVDGVTYSGAVSEVDVDRIIIGGAGLTLPLWQIGWNVTATAPKPADPTAVVVAKLVASPKTGVDCCLWSKAFTGKYSMELGGFKIAPYNEPGPWLRGDELEAVMPTLKAGDVVEFRGAGTLGEFSGKLTSTDEGDLRLAGWMVRTTRGTVGRRLDALRIIERAPEPGADIPDEVVDAAWDAFDEYHESTRESFRAALAAADAKRAELEGQA